MSFKDNVMDTILKHRRKMDTFLHETRSKLSAEGVTIDISYQCNKCRVHFEKLSHILEHKKICAVLEEEYKARLKQQRQTLLVEMVRFDALEEFVSFLTEPELARLNEHMIEFNKQKEAEIKAAKEDGY